MKIRITKAWTLIVAFYAVAYLIYKFIGINTVNYSFIYFLIAIGIYFILEKNLYSNDMLIGNKWLWLLAFLLALTVVTGTYFDNKLPFEMMKIWDYFNYLLCVIGLGSIFKCLLGAILKRVEKWADDEKDKVIKKENNAKLFLKALAIILGCWLFVWLAYYPGLWNYDPWQVNQVICRQFDKWHPLLHTLLLGICYIVGTKIRDATLGVILYDFVQMLTMAGIFSYTYVYIRKHISSKVFRGMVLAFYAILPVNSIMAISTTKDVIFSGLVLFCLVLSIHITEITSNRAKNVLQLILIIACISMLLFRNNVIYAFGLFVIFAFVLVVLGRIKGGYWLSAIALCMLASIATDTLMTKVLHASKGEIREAFSIPSQQFGRIYDKIYESGQDREALDIINSYYDMEISYYNPYKADSMKGTLVFENNEGIVEYVIYSVKLFFKYPVVTLDSFLYLTEGGWNICDTSHSCMYGSGLEGRQGYLLTDVKTGYGIVHESKLPALESFLERAFSNNEYQSWPILSLAFSPALYVWILVVCTVVFIKTKSRYYGLIISFLWFLYLTMLAGPCVLIRYYYPFVTCCPMLICMLNLSLRGVKAAAIDEGDKIDKR